MKPFLAAAIQMNSTRDAEQNLQTAAALLQEAAAKGAQVAALPEYLHSAGRDTQEAAEPIPGGRTFRFLSEQARQHHMWILGGTVLEQNPDGLPWNTSMLFAPDGALAAKYRKVHLCDIKVPGVAALWESQHMSAGQALVLADAGDLGRFGLTICYDVRFPELYRLLALKGAHTFFVPADFARNTGRAHRELLLRARAVENGCYVIAPQQCGEKAPGTFSCGETMIVDPWGTVLARLDDAPGVITAEIDPDQCRRRRDQLGLFANRREDLYRLQQP